MAVEGRAEAEKAPKVYALDDLPDHWVAEGTDGYLYMVPSQPGGWMQCSGMLCSIYEGCTERLKSIPAHQARSIVWLVYGDMGSVQIAEG